MALGCPRGAIIVDPGIGFGKTPAQNLALLRDLGRAARAGPAGAAGHQPQVDHRPRAGPARRRAPGGHPRHHRAGYRRGADIVRVHDVPGQRARRAHGRRHRPRLAATRPGDTRHDRPSRHHPAPGHALRGPPRRQRRGALDAPAARGGPGGGGGPARRRRARTTSPTRSTTGRSSSSAGRRSRSGSYRLLETHRRHHRGAGAGHARACSRSRSGCASWPCPSTPTWTSRRWRSAERTVASRARGCRPRGSRSRRVRSSVSSTGAPSRSTRDDQGSVPSGRYWARMSSSGCWRVDALVVDGGDDVALLEPGRLRGAAGMTAGSAAVRPRPGPGRRGRWAAPAPGPRRR